MSTETTRTDRFGADAAKVVETSAIELDPETGATILRVPSIDRTQGGLIVSIEVALGCGHTTDLHPASSVFDFPDDGTYCGVCGTTQPLVSAEAHEDAAQTVATPPQGYTADTTYGRSPRAVAGRPCGCRLGHRCETHAVEGLVEVLRDGRYSPDEINAFDRGDGTLTIDLGHYGEDYADNLDRIIEWNRARRGEYFADFETYSVVTIYREGASK